MNAARTALIRLAVIVAGFTVMLIGAIMVPLPGPGLLVFAAGVTILAREFHWARRLLGWGYRQIDRVNSQVRQRTGRDLPGYRPPGKRADHNEFD